MWTRRRFGVALAGMNSAGRLAAGAATHDWPEWRGSGRAGVWREDGVLRGFPEEGLRFLWRTSVAAGYSGPSVVDGRVFLTDFTAETGLRGRERALALDASSGRVLWRDEWPADYAGLQYASGPRATPTVDGDRVYMLGAAGDLACFGVADGRPRWRRNFPADFATELPPWGMIAAPLVVGELLIAVVAGRPGAKVVAFDKHSGEEVWRTLDSVEYGPGYSQPLLIEVEGGTQTVIWHAGAVDALDPETGEHLWHQPFPIRMETPIATPVWQPPYLLVSAFFNGSRLFRLDGSRAELVWKGDSDSGVDTDGLHALMASPVISDGHIYGICSYGQLRCLDLETCRRVWETQAVTREKARNASAFLVRRGDEYWINNDRGELILARLSRDGYEEIDRTQLIEPTSKPGARRELGAVHWSHPAYSGRRIFVRNDLEILCADLAADNKDESG